MTSIGLGAFFGSGIVSIAIPENINSIAFNAFLYTENLEQIVVESGNAIYDSRNNCNAIIITANDSLIAGCKNTLIPSDINSIGDRAFTGSRGLTSIIIPNSIMSIGKSAFSYTGLKSVVIPNGVTKICDGTFFGCTSLTSISIPKTVASIDGSPFFGCTNLNDVYCYASSVPRAYSTLFHSSPISSGTLHVPESSVELYQTSYPWNRFGSIVAIDEEMGQTGDFNGDGNITTDDVEVLVNIVLGKIVSGYDTNCIDINKDGKISVSDITALVNKVRRI